ncbi:hypothetical protein PJI19_29240, partial [Mycobacterium kansasii]
MMLRGPVFGAAVAPVAVVNRNVVGIGPVYGASVRRDRGNGYAGAVMAAAVKEAAPMTGIVFQPFEE